MPLSFEHIIEETKHWGNAKHTLWIGERVIETEAGIWDGKHAVLVQGSKNEGLLQRSNV